MAQLFWPVEAASGRDLRLLDLFACSDRSWLDSCVSLTRASQHESCLRYDVLTRELLLIAYFEKEERGRHISSSDDREDQDGGFEIKQSTSPLMSKPRSALLFRVARLLP